MTAFFRQCFSCCFPINNNEEGDGEILEMTQFTHEGPSHEMPVPLRNTIVAMANMNVETKFTVEDEEVL